MRETWHVCSYGKIGTRIRIGYGYQKVISAHLWLRQRGAVTSGRKLDLIER